jgi:hypothetical protein
MLQIKFKNIFNKNNYLKKKKNYVEKKFSKCPKKTKKKHFFTLILFLRLCDRNTCIFWWDDRQRASGHFKI